ncbi:amino acid ABC transporter permease [Qiania dongpingensis]|uniref:Amino acid ABC transporter permease n=1 Tax=Qiania dongpingensis TaxID=2763669 RepID=A0A7G9G452_9FIRM|nr:amino acid ABC transporter permease [Qiania dongpingensis]QNM05584.1 amino acid ABC transporter permease [Qiania dongpingensis]
MTLEDRYNIVIKTILGQGMPMTLKLIFMSLFFSLLIGVVLGTIRSLKIPVVDQLLGIYALICRGIPTIMILLFFYAYLTKGTQFWISVLSISLVEGAYMMEVVKGGFLSVDKGQWEAAKSLSLPMLVTIIRIILPQVLLVTIPALMGQIVMLVKGTSVAATIGCMDILRRAQLLLPKFSYPLEIYAYVLIIFFIMCHFLTWLGKKLERTVVKRIMGDRHV